MIRKKVPKSQKARRVQEQRAPKIVENPKSALFIRGQKTNDVVNTALRDLYALKKPLGRLFSKKNAILPFEDASSLEFFSQKNDASLFLFGSHNKKRPNNLVLGRCFDYHILDMTELGIVDYTPLADFKTKKCGIGAKHAFIFTGQVFEQKEEFKQLRSQLLDFFRGPEINAIDLAAVDHVISVAADDEGERAYFRVYNIVLKKSGTRLPRVDLEEMGPSIDFVIRRTKPAAPDTLKEAMKVSRTIKPKKEKNITTEATGTFGRIHMERQDLNKLATRKMKGLRKRRSGDDEDGAQESESVPTETKKRARRDE